MTIDDLYAEYLGWFANNAGFFEWPDRFAVADTPLDEGVRS
jgi:hypothetical protein